MQFLLDELSVARTEPERSALGVPDDLDGDRPARQQRTPPRSAPLHVLRPPAEAAGRPEHLRTSPPTSTFRALAPLAPGFRKGEFRRSNRGKTGISDDLVLWHAVSVKRISDGALSCDSSTVGMGH